MFNLPGDNLDVNCPDCHRPMVELYKMRRTAGDAYVTSGYADNISFRQARQGQGVFILMELFDFIFESIAAMIHRRKLARLCDTVLPTHPKSVVCTQCLFVLRR